MTPHELANELEALAMDYNAKRETFMQHAYHGAATGSMGLEASDAKTRLEVELFQRLPAIVAALRRVEDEWQPIETAPRDGTLLLVWDGYQAFSGFWGRVAHPMNPQAWVGGHCKINHILQPTHWRPLPSPPALSEPAP